MRPRAKSDSKVDAFVTLCGQYKRDVELIVGADRCNSKVYAVYNPVDVGHYLPYRSVRKELRCNDPNLIITVTFSETTC